jgi:hypothetical protein
VQCTQTDESFSSGTLGRVGVWQRKLEGFKASASNWALGGAFNQDGVRGKKRHLDGGIQERTGCIGVEGKKEVWLETGSYQHNTIICTKEKETGDAMEIQRRKKGFWLEEEEILF